MNKKISELNSITAFTNNDLIVLVQNNETVNSKISDFATWVGVNNDTFVTGATFDDNIIYFNRNDSLSAFSVNLSALSVSDYYITGTSLTDNTTLVLTRNDGNSITQDLTSLSGISFNTLTNTGHTHSPTDIVYSGTYPSVEGQLTTTLPDNTSGGTLTVGSTDENYAVIIDYVIVRGATFGEGQIRVLSDGTTASISILEQDLGVSVGLTWDDAINDGGLIKLEYTTTNIGVDIDMYYNIRRIMK